MTTSLSQQRRAVFTALSTYLEGDTLFKAMWIWQNSHYKVTRFSVSHFVLELCNEFNISATYVEICQSIKECLVLPEKNLEKDPIESMARDQKSSENNNNYGEPHTFSVLMIRIGKTLEATQGQQILRQISDQFHIQGFTTRFTNAILDNMGGSSKVIIRLGKNSSYTKAVNAIYIGLCEALGPVKADEVLSVSVQVVDKSKYGKIYSATNFL